MTALVPIERTRSRWTDGEIVSWIKSLPFFKSTDGVLAHRVRSGFTFLDEKFGKLHSVVEYICGNHGQVSRGTLLADPGDIIVCARCEAIAKSRGLQSCDELVGRHCHVGGIKSFRTCCQEAAE